jgi:hypothetical protein
MKVTLKEAIPCCYCRTPFRISDADMCGGCDGTQTLVCPNCKKCACNRVKGWEEQGKLKHIDDDRFEWVHQDAVAVEYLD